MATTRDSLYDQEYNCPLSDLVDGYPVDNGEPDGAIINVWDTVNKKIYKIFKKILGVWNFYGESMNINPPSMPINTTVPARNIDVEIQRPANTDAYTPGDLLNVSVAADSLPKISFGAEYANKIVELTGVSIITDGGPTKMSDFRLYFYQESTLIDDDNVAFAQTYADHKAKRAGQPVEVTTNFDQLAANGLGMRIATELCRKIQLNAEGEVYFAAVVGSYANQTGFTPASGQNFTFAFHFYTL